MKVQEFYNISNQIKNSAEGRSAQLAARRKMFDLIEQVGTEKVNGNLLLQFEDGNITLGFPGLMTLADYKKRTKITDFRPIVGDVYGPENITKVTL